MSASDFENLGSALVGERGLHRDQFVANDAHQPRARTEDVEVVGDLGGELVQRLGDFVAAERGQTRETQLQDRARLRVGEADRSILRDRVARVGDQADQRRHVAGRPDAFHQRGARRARVRRRPDQADHFVDIGHRDRQADLDVRRVARLGEQIFGAPRHDFLAEVEEGDQHVLEIHHLRATAVQRDHVRAEARLHRGEAPELIEHHVCDRFALELDDDAHAVAIELVAQVRDSLQFLLANEFGDLLDQRRLVDLIRDFRDDQRFAILAQGLGVDLGAHDDRAAPGVIGGADAGAAENRAPGREIRPGNMFHQILDGHVRLVHQREQSVDRLAQIVRRDIGRHADRDAARAVDEQVGKARRQNRGLELLLVVVRLEVDRVLVEVLQQGHRDLLEPRFGVPRGCRRVAVDRAEIALPIDQRRAHGKILRHAHQRVVDREIAVRVELAHRLADGARRLVVGPIGREIQLAHRVENAPVHRLQTVAHVRKRAADDHAHRVIEIAALHLVEDRNRFDVLRTAARGPFVFVVSQFGRVLKGRSISISRFSLPTPPRPPRRKSEIKATANY